MRDRTADLLRARQALSQLSYSPLKVSSAITNLPGNPIGSNQGAVAGRITCYTTAAATKSGGNW